MPTATKNGSNSKNSTMQAAKMDVWAKLKERLGISEDVASLKLSREKEVKLMEICRVVENDAYNRGAFTRRGPSEREQTHEH